MSGSIRPNAPLLNPDLQRPSALDSNRRGVGQLWLDKNENLDAELMRLSCEILQGLPAETLATYPESGDLYRKLAQWTGVDPRGLLLTPGSDGAIRLVFEAFVGRGDAVVHSSPTFAMYPVYCQMFGAESHPIEYQRSETGPWIDVDDLIATVRSVRPKLVCLPNPDSPSGSIVEPNRLRDLLTACEQAGAVLLLDEAYHPFYPWTAVAWTETSANLVVARTFAKAWGAAGMRIGYAAAHPSTATLLHKMRPMYEVGTVSVEFMTRMLDHVDAMMASVARINEGKRRFMAEMEALGFHVLPTHGNFLHVAFAERGQAVHAALRDRVLYRAGFSQPCLAGYSRFSIAPWPVMEEVANLIKQAVGVGYE